MTTGQYNHSPKQRTQLKNILPSLFMAQLTIWSSSYVNSPLPQTAFWHAPLPPTTEHSSWFSTFILIFNLQQRTPGLGGKEWRACSSFVPASLNSQGISLLPAAPGSSVGSEADDKMQTENIAGNGKNSSLPQKFPFLHLHYHIQKGKALLLLKVPPQLLQPSDCTFPTLLPEQSHFPFFPNLMNSKAWEGSRNCQVTGTAAEKGRQFLHFLNVSGGKYDCLMM